MIKKGVFKLLSINNTFLKKLKFILLALLVISLPFSVALANILCGLLLLYWLLFYDNKKELLSLFKKNPIVFFAYLFFLSFLISLIWSDNLERGFEVIKKELLLLFIPIFMMLIEKGEEKVLIKLFIFSMSILVFISYLVYFGVLDFISKTFEITPTPYTPFMTHISYNPFLALAIYLLIYYFFKVKKIKLKIFIALLIILMSINMFITGGRAGQVAFFVLLLVAFFQFIRISILKTVIFLFSLASIFILAYNFSPLFKERVNGVIYEVNNLEKSRNRSVGLRITMWENSIRIIKNNPIFGVGVGDFSKEYKKVSEKYTPNAISDVFQPHNMYLFVWTSNGIFSLLILFILFFIQIFISFRKNDEFKPIRLALAILFLVIMFYDSYLLGFHTTLLFVIFTSILYKNTNWNDIKQKKY